MPSVLELRWEFAPKGLFEDQLTCEFSECKITVDDGTVLATLPLVAGETQSELRRNVEAYVESLFLGAQVAANTSCQLGGPSVTTVQEAGSKGYIVECKPAVLTIRAGKVDVRYTQADGKVVDTRQERIERKHRLSLAAAEYAPNDQALARMLRSYCSGIIDTQDELIHLYEVRDTLATTFGSKTEALRGLRQPEGNWNRLGVICNVLPLRQGRHRGQAVNELRDATEEELTEARSLAAQFIESYIEHIRGKV